MKKIDSETLQDFPQILSKQQSGSLFTKVSLIKTLSKSSKPKEISSSPEESPKFFNSFHRYFMNFYKHSRLNVCKLQTNKLNYFQDLFEQVIEKGGWSLIVGRDYWTQLGIPTEYSESFKEDYETYLFPIEKSNEYVIPSFSSILSISPSLMKNAEFLRPTDEQLLINDQIINQLMHKIALVLPSANVLFQLDLDLWTGNWGEGAVPLNTWPERSEEFSVKILNSLHWNGNENLIRYTKLLLGVSLPEVVTIEKSCNFTGKKNISQIFFVLEGQLDWFGVKKSDLSNLKPLKKDLNLKDWVPDEQFLLKNSVEFTFIKSFKGDMIISNEDFYWWAVGSGVVATWMILPCSRLELFCVDYLNNLSHSEIYNIPLIAVEILNRQIGEISDKDFSLLKQVVNESIPDESWHGTYVPEKEDHRNCAVCQQELFWRYSMCQDSLGVAQPNCLKCSLGHNCKNRVFVEKFSPVDLDLFLGRLEKNTKSSIQKPLIKSNLKPCPNLINSVQVDHAKLKTYEESLIKTIKPVLQNLFQSEESYKRKGLKKQKISESHSNGSICYLEESESPIDDSTQKKNKNKNKS